MTRRSQHQSTAAIGRIQARPTLTATAAPAGLHQLGLDGQRDALLYVPPTYQPTIPTPLLLMLHGAGGAAQHSLALLQALADANGMLLLSPPSRRQTWDVIYGSYGPDIAFLDRALQLTFEKYTVDPTHLAIGGFSDGASYALSVGLTNGDLFSHVLAFSPGFMVPADQQGLPKIFISHGIHDAVLPLERCSRRIVPQLQQAGYKVLYHEFDGPHTVPAEIASAAINSFTLNA